MGVAAFFSAKGSPGATTTALLAAALWPRPAVLVDADPDGGDVALRLPSEAGTPVDAGRGLLTLLPLARRQLAPSVVREHAQTLLGGVEVVAGLAGPEQSGAVGPLWATLATAFRDVPDADVLVDLGRLHSQSAHATLAREADAVVCVLRLTVASVIHSRERLRALEPTLRSSDGRRPRVGLVVVAPAGSERDVNQVAESIQAAAPSVELFGQLALDTAAAEMFDGRPVTRPERTLLVRSGRRVVGSIAASVAGHALPHTVTGPLGAVAPVTAAAQVPAGAPSTATTDGAEPALASRRALRGRSGRRS